MNRLLQRMYVIRLNPGRRHWRWLVFQLASRLVPLDDPPPPEEQPSPRVASRQRRRRTH